ncbi:Oxidoreductase, molybdopterin-binding domain-containing protein, partial [Earliella scabrosa]
MAASDTAQVLAVPQSMQPALTKISDSPRRPADKGLTILEASGPRTYSGAGWREALRTNNSLISVRDVKNAVTNYKLRNPKKNHDYSRYVLPVTEAEIKEQDWPWRNVALDNSPNSASSPGSMSSSTTAVTDDTPSVDTEDSIAENPADAGDEQANFLKRVTEEFRTIRAFRNNLGVPKGELKLLDGDATEQLERCLSMDDLNTPDSWIPRSSELFRLTEPNLLRLFEAGMITPTKLHFVRNHAAVPQLDWETHELAVYARPPSLLTKPRQFTMEDLTSGGFNVIEIPVTMGCDGNRRKEVNMVKRTVGFNWTASGVSTAIWRGVPVRDVLLSCGLQETPPEERWYLNFEGADEPADGPYSTAIPLTHAMNPANDVILAFGMNGRVLHPDHGYPLRVIIPGYVGGRQIKWLNKMWVTKEPNMSYY